MKCSGAVYEDDEKHIPCKCPVCGGFLKWKNIDDVPKCNRCKTELIAIPVDREKNDEHFDWDFKICPISERAKEELE